MTVRFYSSGDAGAPVLRGTTPGDLINLLEKCLVTGYGSKAGAGWTKPFHSGNVATFRQGAGSNGMYLRVDDTSAPAGNVARSARVVGYETMSDVNTGSPISFPTPAQLAGGGYWVTNGAGNPADARPWEIVADEMFFWFRLLNIPANGVGQNNGWEHYCFGDMIPFKPGDTTHTILLFKNNNTPNTSHNGPFEGQAISTNLAAGNGFNLVVARSFTQIGGPQYVGWHNDMTKGSASWGNGNLTYPHAVDGGLYLSPVWVHETHTSPYNVRGKVPGAWVHCHSAGIFSQSQIIEGQGELAGKSFMHCRASSTSMMLEISDTWDR